MVLLAIKSFRRLFSMVVGRTTFTADLDLLKAVILISAVQISSVYYLKVAKRYGKPER
jgi:hypothetical protein